jgi:hypothetical protein
MKIFKALERFFSPKFYGGSSAPSNTSSTTKITYDGDTTKMRKGVFDLTNQFIDANKPKTPEQVQAEIASVQAKTKATQSNLDKYAKYVASGKSLNPEQAARQKKWQEELASANSKVATLQGGQETQGEQKALNSDYDSQLDTRGDLINAQAGNVASVYDKILGGSYDTNFKPISDAKLSLVDNVTEAGDYQQAEAGAGYYDAPEFTQLADYFDAIAQNSPDYQTAVASLSPDYQDIKAETSPIYNGASASISDLSNGAKALGAIDPTTSLQRLLSGQIDNPYLNSINQGNINQSMQGYNDMLQNLNQQVMPSINSDAFAAGQYGGSRQGIAQGLAMQQAERNARDLTQSNVAAGSQLFGNAYQNAQQNMYGTANSLMSLAGQNTQFNANSLNDISKLNANNNLQNEQFGATNINDILKFNANNNLQNSQFNTTNLNNMEQFNAGNMLQKGQFDTGQQNNMEQFNAANLLQNNQYGANLENQFALSNAKNAADVSTANAGYTTQAGLTNANNSLSQSQFNANAYNNAALNNMQQSNNMSQFNANLGLQNNTQQMGQTTQNLQNSLTGLNTGQAGLTALSAGQDSIYGAQNSLLNYDNNKMLDLIDVGMRGASMTPGNTTTTTMGNATGGNNLLGQVGGTALTAGALYSMVK